MFTYKFNLIEPDKTAQGYKNITNYGTLPFIGFSEKMPLNEELDSGRITILSHNSETLPIFTIVEMLVYEEGFNAPKITRKYYLGQDEVTTQDKMLGGQIVYEHQLQLIEFTKKFEKVVCEFYCFTQSYNPNVTFYTLNDAINRVMRIAPLGEDDMSNTWDYGQPYDELPIPSDRVFDTIDTKITNIGNNEIPQLFLDQGTLREKLDAILKTINGIARLKSRMFGSQEKVKVLTVDLFNELKNILSDLKLDNMNNDINIEEINSNMETFLDNSVNEISQNSAQIVYPNIPNGYDRLKTNDNNYVLTDSNCGIRTEYPIYRVDSLIIPIKIAYQISPLQELSLDLDVTNYVIEQTDFDALPIGTDSFVIDITNITLPETQRMYLPYTYKSNFINCGNNNKGFIFTYPNFNTMITAIATKYYIDNYVTDPDVSISLSITVGGERTGGFTKSANDVEGTISTEASFDPSVVEYRIKYTPIYDSHFATDKNSTLQVKVNATSLENQSTRIMSFENFSNNLLSSSQRVGTQQREVTIRHLHANELLQNGDYFNDTNEIITECEYIYYNNFIVGKYLLSKDYNRINEYIGINSEIRQWQVPGNVYDRKLLIKNYLEIDSEGKDNTSYLTELGCETILDNFVFDANRQIYKATNVFYDSSNTLLNLEWSNIMSDDLPNYRRKILLGCVNNGGGNIISLGWTTQDNMCVTPVVETYTEQGVTKYLIKKVPYCIPYGEYMGFLRNFNFIISNKNVDAIPTNMLPFVMKRTINDNNTLFNDPNDLVRVPNMLVLKDPSERLTMNYQVSVVSNSEYITVGKWFTIDNLMIKDYDRSIPLTLDIYTSTTKHGKTFNDRVDASYTNSGHDIFYYFDANCNQPGYDYSQTPRFNLQLTHHISELFGQNIKEIVFADPDTNKIHLVVDVNYFQPTYSGGTVVLGQDTIHFNFTKKRSNLNYDY